jgi:peroxiredoxin
MKFFPARSSLPKPFLERGHANSTGMHFGPIFGPRIFKTSILLTCFSFLFALNPNLSAGAFPPGAPVIDLAGHAVDPLHNATAKAIVLVFVRTDCPISNRYAPVLNDLYRKFAGNGASFWLIYLDPHQSLQEVRRHVEEYGYHAHIGIDRSHSLAKAAGVHVTPEVAVFSSRDDLLYRGRIDNRYIDIGEALPAPTHKDLELALQAVLAGQAITNKTTTPVGCYISDLE